MSFSQLLRILRARCDLVVFVMALALCSAVTASILLPKKYLATASLVVDTRGVDPVTGASSPAQSTETQLATQLDVITSRAVALRATGKLGLATGTAADAAARDLLRHVTAKPSRESKVIQISFEDRDPVFAARAANAFADSYLETSLELKLDPAKRQSAWFEQQLQGLRQSVEERRSHLADFQKSNGIVATDDRLDVENARLEEISRQLLDAQRTAKNTNARMNQADRALASGQLQEVPDLMGNSLLQSMKTDLTRAEGKLAELGERYDRNHPQYIAAAAEVRTLSSRLSAEVQNAKGAISQSAQIAGQQVAELQAAFNAQKQRILQLQGQRSEMATQSREVENAQAAYDSALQRSNQLRLESQLNQTNVAVLDRADVPAHTARPGLALSATLALVFGAMLGAALALMLERLDRRVRTGYELVEIDGLEVLGHVPHLRASFRPPARRLRHSERLLQARTT